MARSRRVAQRGMYQFTPRRRAQLKRAAYISAQKRHARRKTIVRSAALAGIGTAAVAGVVIRHKVSGSKLSAGRKVSLSGNTPRTLNAHIGGGSIAVTGRARHGGTALQVAYHHKSVFGSKTKSKIRVNRNAIPHYNPLAKASHWPQHEARTMEIAYG